MKFQNEPFFTDTAKFFEGAIGAPTEHWWIIIAKNNMPLTYETVILLFSRESLARRFMRINKVESRFELVRVMWRDIVKNYQEFSSEVALDWRGPQKPWHPLGGRYRLR